MAELYVALDHHDAPAAVELLDQLPTGAPVKIGSVLMTRAGHGFVRSVLDAGHPVFLDLKWHDIPNTVERAVAAAADLGVRMVTVHAVGGEVMLRAAVEAAAGRVDVVAVTVLTSLDAAGYAAATGREAVDLRHEVVRLATLAMTAGAAGVVCSPAELEVVRPVVGQGRLVVPGIRREGEAAADQSRVATPEQALALGATDLVVGRPITESANPAEAWAGFRALLGG
ncbi:MAG: orotidine-5'-phosphate decarboxylase [Gemmatimonadota bacterium]